MLGTETSVIMMFVHVLAGSCWFVRVPGAEPAGTIGRPARTWRWS
jgi:hypothetical protein